MAKRKKTPASLVKGRYSSSFRSAGRPVTAVEKVEDGSLLIMDLIVHQSSTAPFSPPYRVAQSLANWLLLSVATGRQLHEWMEPRHIFILCCCGWSDRLRGRELVIVYDMLNWGGWNLNLA